MTQQEAVSLGAGRVALHTAVQTAHLGVEVDRDGRILRLRPGAIQVFGLATPDGAGEYASDLFVADDVLSARALLHRAARDEMTAPVLLRMRQSDGAELVVRVSARASDGVVDVRIRECDATERSAFYASSAVRTRFDPLTGLPNRLLWLELARAAMESGPQNLVLIDVDRFRQLVTAFGARLADRILVEVSDRLVASIGACGIAGRSGRQFALLVPLESAPDTISSLVARIQAAIRAPFVPNADTIELSACLGVATSGAGADAEALFADAEVALAQAKALGPARDAIFDPAFRRRAVRRVEMQYELSRAIADEELRLDFQPIVELETDAIVGYEALVRWQHPDRGVLAPRDFLGIAQDCGAGAAIDNWVLVEACRQGSQWARAAQPANICVNVAPERFAVAGFVERVERALSITGLDPGRLVIEITEWGILVDVDAARDTLSALNRVGVRVALDDYGTGYSSLADLAALPVDELKIDTSFVAGLGSDRARTAIVHAIVGLGQMLGITVVAEGIENAAQALALRAVGCQFGQGFHLGSPGPGPLVLGTS
jgi:diguanylate cyclase (GGDEF)-like protein